jgi:catalase
MNGYGLHAFSWVNAAGEIVWVKYHFMTNQGVECLTQEEADRLAGVDPDCNIRDLYEAIQRGGVPELVAEGADHAVRGRQDLSAQSV